jgi:hypothetical protein
VLQDAVEHRRGEHAVAGEGGLLTAEGEIRGKDQRTALVPLRYHLEEQGWPAGGSSVTSRSRRHPQFFQMTGDTFFI